MDLDVAARDVARDIREPVLVRALLLLGRHDEQKRDRQNDQERGIGPHPACIGRGGRSGNPQTSSRRRTDATACSATRVSCTSGSRVVAR